MPNIVEISDILLSAAFSRRIMDRMKDLAGAPMGGLTLPAIFRVGGKKVTVSALVDTGADATLLALDMGEKIGAAKSGRIFIRGVAGKASVREGTVDEIVLPGTGCKAGKMKVILFEKKLFPAGGVTGMDAVIGRDFMTRAGMNVAALAKTFVVGCRRKS